MNTIEKNNLQDQENPYQKNTKRGQRIRPHLFGEMIGKQTSLLEKTKYATKCLIESQGAFCEALKEAIKIGEVIRQISRSAMDKALQAFQTAEDKSALVSVTHQRLDKAIMANDTGREAMKLISEKAEVERVLANKGIETFGKIQAADERMTDLVKILFGGNNEQVKGIEDSYELVAEIADLMHEIEANAEEITAASEEVNALARWIKEKAHEGVVAIREVNNGRTVQTPMC